MSSLDVFNISKKIVDFLRDPTAEGLARFWKKRGHSFGNVI